MRSSIATVTLSDCYHIFDDNPPLPFSFFYYFFNSSSISFYIMVKCRGFGRASNPRLPGYRSCAPTIQQKRDPLSQVVLGNIVTGASTATLSFGLKHHRNILPVVDVVERVFQSIPAEQKASRTTNHNLTFGQLGQLRAANQLILSANSVILVCKS